MAAGADSIDEMDLLRHGAMLQVFAVAWAPSTLGSFLRSFTWGNVLQLGKVSRELLAELARRAPLLPPCNPMMRPFRLRDLTERTAERFPGAEALRRPGSWVRRQRAQCRCDSFIAGDRERASG